jgi:hypothetical protein
MNNLPPAKRGLKWSGCGWNGVIEKKAGKGLGLNDPGGLYDSQSAQSRHLANSVASLLYMTH